MTQDQSPQLPSARPPGPGRVVMAGVVAAAALGVAAGLWARPADPAEDAARAGDPPPEPPAALQIVIDDSPAPVGRLLEVLPGVDSTEAATPHPEVMVPRRPATGLVRVDAPIAAAPPAVPTVRLEPPPEPEPSQAAPPPKPKPVPQVVRKSQVERRAAAKPAPDPANVAAARAAKARAADVRMAETRASQARATKAAELAAKLAKAEKAKALARAEQARLAKAAARREAAARAETRRLAALKAQREEARKAEKRQAVQLADARAAKAAKARKPKAVKPKAAPARVETAARAPAPKRVVVPRGEGPMRVARVNPCAVGDPGEAIVCADPRLSARERQLQQAYRNAEAAGVPASALRRQQARWQQARAAAAREAPWAVEDVYVARISELNDQTRDAREN